MRFADFFSNVQEASWYHEFLMPVVSEIPEGSTLLDIGTGPGKLLEMAINRRSVQATGMDNNRDMVKAAGKKLSKMNCSLFLLEDIGELPSRDQSFDVITYCNLLFLLPETEMRDMLSKAGRLLKESGKMLVLTPSGRSGLLTFIRKVFPGNLSMVLWYLSTTGKARRWGRKNPLQVYAHRNRLGYSKEYVFNGLAVLETLTS